MEELEMWITLILIGIFSYVIYMLLFELTKCDGGYSFRNDGVCLRSFLYLPLNIIDWLIDLVNKIRGKPLD